METLEGRKALGSVLAQVNDRTYPEIKALLSVLVRHKGLTDIGAGFYDYAADHNLLPPKASAERKLIFMASQLQAVLDHCKRVT